MDNKLDLLDCIAHGTSIADFMKLFDGDTHAAAQHLADYYLNQLAESTIEGSNPTDEEMRVAIRDAERVLARG